MLIIGLFKKAFYTILKILKRTKSAFYGENGILFECRFQMRGHVRALFGGKRLIEHNTNKKNL